jgi:hypothetical protein
VLAPFDHAIGRVTASLAPCSTHRVSTRLAPVSFDIASNPFLPPFFLISYFFLLPLFSLPTLSAIFLHPTSPISNTNRLHELVLRSRGVCMSFLPQLISIHCHGLDEDIYMLGFRHCRPTVQCGVPTSTCTGRAPRRLVPCSEPRAPGWLAP